MRVLLIEDDVDLCRSLAASLEKQGMRVTLCHDGEEGLYLIRENEHDLVLLDRMLPRVNGAQVLREARACGCSVPVIILTALGSVQDRIDGLDLGADDYLVKPFAFEELMARIRSVSRRPRPITPLSGLTFGDLIFHPDESLLLCGEKSCTLSRREGELMALFLSNPERTLPRSNILNRIWGAEAEIESGNLDNYIHFLRRRLQSVESRVILRTIRGIGYRIETP